MESYDQEIIKKILQFPEDVKEAKPVLWEAPTGDIQTVGGVVSLTYWKSFISCRLTNPQVRDSTLHGLTWPALAHLPNVHSPFRLFIYSFTYLFILCKFFIFETKV